MARKSMIGQMSKQMNIPRKEAGGLMAKAKKMNESARTISDADRARADRERRAISRAQAGGFKEGGHVVAISVYNVTKGSEDVPVEWGRKKLDRGTEKLIQGTESQVRGRYFNDNDGKGTF